MYHFPNIPIFHNFGGFGGFGEDVTKFAQVAVSECVCYAIMQFG